MTTRRRLLPPALLVLALSLPTGAFAQAAPAVSPALKKMLGGLPIEGIKDELQGMVAALEKTPCGGGLKGCYGTRSGPLQMYFFTGASAQQTLLLVVDKKMALPHLLGDKVQHVMGGTALRSPIISISTSDFALDFVKMPPALQQVVRDSYFNVGSLAFSSGVQMAARADLGGPIKAVMEGMGVKGNQLTMRAAVVMPIPSDLAGAAGAGAGAAQAVSDGQTMEKAGADAARPEAFVEFQFAPNARLPLRLPAVTLTDATFFLNNALTFGYKGNAYYDGVADKPVLMQFQTPLTPEGVMDLADFSFRMATPPSFTLEDAAHVMVAMATPDARLAKYGGGFIRQIESYKQALLTVTKPLSVFQLRNPNPAPVYRFGDSAHPFPTDDKVFNIALLGPLADGGPWMHLAGDTVILGQKMGWLEGSAGASGLHGKAGEGIDLKLGPLGRVKVKMAAQADIDRGTQAISLRGNFVGQAVNVVLSGSSLSIEVPPSCANPFEIKTTVAIQASTDLAEVFEGQGGVNVDPSKISGCIGKELEAAYRKIAGEYKSLGGYTASAANAELKKIDDAAAAAAAEAKRQAEAAQRDYNRAKDAARDAASKSTNAANSALKAADNAFKGFGKKHHHKKAPDPRFASSVFDWDYYYDHAPDVVRAKEDLSTHWRDNGFREGRRGSLEFHAKYYRDRYLDVQALCGSTDYDCVVRHWLDHGLPLGRQGSPDFSVADYIARYPDLREIYGKGDYLGAIKHWNDHGEDEGRNGRPASDAVGPLRGPVRIGGDGGGAWSDDAVCHGGYVIGWRLFAGRLVDHVQFRYPGGWAPGQGGSGAVNADVTLAPGEYVVRVDYRSGNDVDSLSFHTNKGRHFGPYGGGGGSPGTFEVTPGEKLGCMQGRSGKYTDQLTFSSTGPR